MSTRSKKCDRHDDVVYGAYQWWKDCEDTYTVALQLEMFPNKQKGVFDFRMDAWFTDLFQERRTVARLTRPWPNAAGQSYSAFLLQMVLEIERMVGLWHGRACETPAHRRNTAAPH